MFGVVARNVNALSRRTIPNIFRNGYHGGTPGENLPFDVTNPYKLTLYFSLFFGSGLAVPYLVVRHQLLKH